MKNQNHNKTLLKLFLLILLGSFILVIPTFAEGVTAGEVNASKFGILTLLPPLIAIILAFITKNVVISLFLGILVGGFLLNLTGFNIFSALYGSFNMAISSILNSLASPWNAGIILQCLTIGGLIALICKMGGTKAVAEALAKKAKSPRSSQLITFLLGLFVFFDDYANSLIVGPIMKPVSDKMKISREKLAFIVDSTAAPISGIALISTWIGYELSLIKNGFNSLGIKANAYSVFIDSIPFRFYNILILIFIVFTALLLREFGPMYKSETRARTTGETLRKDSNPLSSEDSDMAPKDGVKLRVRNAVIPILVLIITSFIGFYVNGYGAIMADTTSEYYNIIQNSPFSFNALQATFGASDASIVLFSSALIASIVAIILGFSQKIFTISEAIEIWINGMKSLMITGVILLLAWSLSSIIADLGTAPYLVSILKDSILPPFLLPSIIFILSSIISFATGTSYGTMGILMPLTIPLAYALKNDYSFVVLCISSVLTGSIVGDHCSPISDTTILSSMGCGCDHLDHVKTQMLYAIVVALVSIFCGYIPCGLGLSIYIALPLSILTIFLIVRFIGKPIASSIDF